MNTGAIASVIFVAIMWGGWPLVARASTLSSVWTAIIGTTIGAIAVLGTSAIFGQIKNAPDIKSILLGVVAGVMLGLGMFAYSRLISNPEWEVSVLVPIAAGCITAITAVGGIVLFGEVVSAVKIAGLTFVVVGIALLS